MDPLTTALAVISLATAVKDMVELAQNIHKSFAKVSSNLRKAQHVAKDIAEMVEKINVFYTNHQKMLDKMDDFRVALLGLLNEFRSFEASILPQIAKKGGKRLGRFIRRWWNNNKIEEHILNLEKNVVQVMLKYMVDSTMRTEVKLQTIHQNTSEGLTGITRGLDVVRRTVFDIADATVPRYSRESSGRRSDEFNRNVIKLALSSTSTSAPMLSMPKVITEELMTTAYIKLQIDKIAMVVEKITVLPAFAATSIEFRLAKVFEQPSMGMMHLRHDVVRQVTTIRDLLDSKHIQTVSIYDGARALNELSVGLSALRMHDECLLVGKWAITLVRALVGVSDTSQPNLVAYLALYLANASMEHDFDIYHSDKVQSPRLIEESYAMTQNLRSEHPGEVPFQISYSNVLLKYAELVDKNRSIGMLMESIQVLEKIFNVQAFTQSDSQETLKKIVQPNSSLINRLFSSAPTAFSIMIYAEALRRLGKCLLIAGWHESALGLWLLGIAVLREMVSVYGYVHKAQLASALFVLVREGNVMHIPAEELIDMAEECAQLYRLLAEHNPATYGRHLVGILWDKARTLESLKRDAEAITAWQEAAKVAEQIAQDSALCAFMLSGLSNHFRRLKRYDDAAHTETMAIVTDPCNPDDQAYRYTYLSEDLQHLRRYKEAAEAAQTSVEIYRCKAVREPQVPFWMWYLTENLSKLAHCLAALGNYSEAMLAWEESIKIADNLLNHNPDTHFSGSREYIATICTHLSVSCVLEDEAECLKVCSTSVQNLRYALGLESTKEDIISSLLAAELRYAYTMNRFGRLQAAQQYIDNRLDVWSSEPRAISKSKIAEWNTSMIVLKADVLDAQGYTEHALLAIQKVHDIVKPSAKTHQSVFEKMIDAVIQQIRLQVSLGNGEEGQRVAEGALHLCRDNKLDPVIGTLILSLYGVAFAASSCQDYKRVVEAAREGCNLLNSAEGLEIWETDEQNISKRASLYAFLSSAEANLGNRSTAIEYAYRAVDVSQEIKERKADISATTAERSYMETRGNVADILLATGHLAQAWEICKERRDYFSKRVDKWMGDYRELAPVLRILGILSCSEGRHEEGEAAAEELSRIMVTLGNAFPSLQEQVKIRLRNQAKVPILKVLDDMSVKLDCQHQAGVVSLFEL